MESSKRKRSCCCWARCLGFNWHEGSRCVPSPSFVIYRFSCQPKKKEESRDVFITTWTSSNYKTGNVFSNGKCTRCSCLRSVLLFLLFFLFVPLLPNFQMTFVLRLKDEGLSRILRHRLTKKRRNSKCMSKAANLSSQLVSLYKLHAARTL